MKKNPVVLLAGQETPATPHRGGAVTHLIPEGGLLQAATPRGIGYPDTNVTIRDPRRNPERGGDRSGIKGTAHRLVRRFIGDQGIASEEVDEGGDMGEVPRHKTVG